MAKAKTEAYIVIKRNTLDHEIGDEIELTADKAASLIGKVRLKSEGALDQAKADLTAELKLEVAALKAEKEMLEEMVEQIGKENKALKAEPKKAAK